jgi:hypothetical protein
MGRTLQRQERMLAKRNPPLLQMNTFLAASLFDSPWVILVIVIVGALSNWLMKRRQGNQQRNVPPEGDELLPPPAEPQERSPRELDLQEVLRQILGGEPPPRPTQPPPIPSVRRDAKPTEVWSDEEQFQRQQTLMDEAEEPSESPQPRPTLPRAHATGVEPGQRPEQIARHAEPFMESGRHPATVVSTGRPHRSHGGTRAIALVRDPRTLRQAFVASLVFGPPKALES